MHYILKDTIQIFLIGLIPSLFFKQGVWCWLVICIARYIIKGGPNPFAKAPPPKTREYFHSRGFYPRDDWFDENGIYIGNDPKALAERDKRIQLAAENHLIEITQSQTFRALEAEILSLGTLVELNASDYLSIKCYYDKPGSVIGELKRTINRDEVPDVQEFIKAFHYKHKDTWEYRYGSKTVIVLKNQPKSELKPEPKKWV